MGIIQGRVNRYKVTLTQEERCDLENITRRGKTHSHRFIHARALLLCDAGTHGQPWKVADVAKALGCSSRSIEHLKERFVEEGLEAALERKKHSRHKEITFDGAFDARVCALVCSSAPEGFARWTVRLLADKIVALKIAEKVSAMTVHRSLKKPMTSSSESILENPPRSLCRVCRRHGRHTRYISSALRPGGSAGLHG